MKSSGRLIPFFHRPDLSNSRGFGPHLVSFLATADVTGGQFSLLEIRLVGGHEPPPYSHSQDDEAFYVLEGELDCRIGDNSVTARTGDFVLLPVGVEHAFRVLGPQARVLLISAPSGLEEAFFALSQPARRLETRLDAPAIDPAHLVATFAKAGLTFRSPNAVEPVTQPNPALVVRPKPGFSRWYFGHLLTPLLNGSQTGGRLTLNELLIRRGQEPPPHVHFGEDEGYYLLDGQITFHCEEHSYVAQTGDFVFLPRGLAHWYHIHTETGRFLLFTTPSGLENYFMEHSQPAEALVLPPRPANAYAPELMSRARVKYGLEYLPAGAETLGH